MKPEVSIIIVNYKTPELIVDCVQSLEKYVRSTSYEIIVVDNESSAGSVALLQKACPRIQIIANPTNSGFGEGNNIGVRHAQGDFLFLTNSDTVLREDSITPLVSFLKKKPDAAMVGPAVFLTDGSRQSRICGNIPTLRRLVNDALLLSVLLPARWEFAQGLHREYIKGDAAEVDWISGVCMLIRRAAYEKVNGFNPDFFLYSEDIDLCLRIARHCGSIYHLSKYGIIHSHGASSKSEEERLRNSVMQQGNFLLLLPSVLAPSQFKKAKVIMKAGLWIRLFIGYLLITLRHPQGSFLVRSCRARLDTLNKD
jgi:GT2 family glycosyltransferase